MIKKLTSITESIKRRLGRIKIVKMSERDPFGKRILFPFYNLGLGDKVFFEAVIRKYREANPGQYLIGLENYGGLSMADYPMPPDEAWRITQGQGQCVGDNARLKRLIDRRKIGKFVFDKYLQVIDWIVQEYHIPVILIGREEEHPKVKRPGVLDVTKDRLTVHQSAAIIGKSSLFIGTDTGPTHLAAALGVPIVYTDVMDSALGPFAPANSYIRVHRRILDWDDGTPLCQDVAVGDILAAVDTIVNRVRGSNDLEQHPKATCS